MSTYKDKTSPSPILMEQIPVNNKYKLGHTESEDMFGRDIHTYIHTAKPV
jgi:hypothetical protein